MRILSITNINNQYKANVAFAAKTVKVSTIKKTAEKSGVDVAAFFSNPENLKLIKRNQRISEVESNFRSGYRDNSAQTFTTMTPFGPIGGKWPHERY